MYESPKELIRDIVPTPIVSFTVVARAAGVLYLSSVILPLVTNRIGFAEYTSAFFGDARALPLPFDLAELLFISTLGTLSGASETYNSVGGGPEGVGLALVDFFITPVLYIGLPLTGAILTLGIVVLGVVFLLGYKRYTTYLTIGFLMVYTAYIAMFGMKTATIHPQAGLYMVYLASTLMLIVSVDRSHQIGLISGNGYAHPAASSQKAGEPTSATDQSGASTGVSRLASKLRPQFSSGESDDSEGESSDPSEETVSYAGSARRNS